MIRIDPISYMLDHALRRAFLWACRRWAPIAYQLGYHDGWEDSIGRPR